MSGGLAEWSNAPVLKTGVRESVPWVRIPRPPPLILNICCYINVLSDWTVVLSPILSAIMQLNEYIQFPKSQASARSLSSRLFLGKFILFRKMPQFLRFVAAFP
jgi:hypothetical protein